MKWIKRLAFILWLAFCVGLGFLIALLSKKICIKEPCIKKTNLIIGDMDLSYKKCENFYKSICGKYGHREKDDSDVNSIWEEIKRKQFRQLVSFLDEPMLKDEDRVLRILKKIYRSCLNTKKIEEEGLQPLRNLIHLAGGFPLAEGEKWTTNYTGGEWILGIEEYNTREAGFTGGHIFRAYIDKLGDYHLVHLSPPKYSEFNDSQTEHYFTYIKSIALTLNKELKESLDQEIIDTLQFKSELKKISALKRNCSRVVERKKVQTVVEEFSFLHFGEFLGNMSLIWEQDDEHTFVYSSEIGKEYLNALKALIEKTPKRIIANYMMIENIIEITPMLPSSFREAYDNLLKKTKGPKFQTETERKVLCTKCMKDKMVSAFSALYLRKYFKTFKRQENINDVVLALKYQMKKLVRDVKWMDGETKKRALWKIDKLDFAAPVPQDIFEELTDKKKFRIYYENLCFTGNISDSLTAFVSLQQFYSDKNWELLQRQVQSFDYDIDIFTSDIKFDYKRNVVVIPIGFMNYPAYNNEWPNYLNYGGFCSKVAMELIHGVDFVGKNYDENGGLMDWWSENTKSMYIPRSRCFVKKYNKYLSSYCTTRVKDPKCIIDDIAALGGIKVAFMAYEDYSKRRFFEERRLPSSLNMYSPKQMFFLDFATFYCHDDAISYYEGMSELEASKSSNEYKVNGVLKNFPVFAEVFGCSNNDTMNPYAKCNIWTEKYQNKI